MLLKNTYLNSLPLTEPLPPPPKKNARKKLTISLREEPPGSRHLVSTIDPKTKEKVPIKGILRVKVVLQHQLSSQFSVQASQTVAVPTTKNEVLPSTEIISPPSQPQTVENKETKPQQEVPRIMDSKPRSLSLIDPETNSLDDSLDNDGLQILTQVEPKSLTANNSLFTPVTKTANTTPSTSATTTTLQSATLDSKATSFKDTISDTISELSSVSSMDEEELKKKRKKKPSSQPTNTSTVAASQSNRKRPNSFSSTSAGAKPQSNTPVIHAPMKFRKPTPPKRNEPTEEESNNVTIYSNYSHRASKTVEESLSSNNYAYTGSLATDTPLFIKAARDKRSMSPGVTKTTPTISRPNSSTLLQPTISSTLKNDPLGTKKRPSSAPKSRPKEEDQENTIFTNMAERSALRSSFTAPNSLSKPVLTSTDLSSSLPKRLNSTTSRNDSSGSGGNRLLRPTLSFLSKTVKKT
ncbi:hypothetical protein C9374_006120 [Naegleria lovaniensis]|uniref:Uncharacterized protein n=1 Tax=Naegleria lovaniensis TaxID=51637 RepID=A0AA88GIR5_NAELO|nr:uncharacterized protein C9374_006120 [Naegleria lovaniensis]KAG2381736.1 hypothetical protein C9374_006120 [Naegleria lovaniensis]